MILFTSGFDFLGSREIAEVTFASADHVRDVLHNFFTADGFASLQPKYGDNWSPKLILP